MKKYTVKAPAGEKPVLFGALITEPPLADITPAGASPIVAPARRHFAAAQAVAAGAAVSDLTGAAAAACAAVCGQTDWQTKHLFCGPQPHSVRPNALLLWRLTIKSQVLK